MIHKCGPLGAMSLVLMPARTDGFLATVAHHLEVPEIFEHGAQSSAENLDALFGKRTVAIRQIADSTFGTIGKSERDKYVIAAITAGIRQSSRLDLYDA